MSVTGSWSVEMDRKLEAMSRDPEVYFAEARRKAREEHLEKVRAESRNSSFSRWISGEPRKRR